MHFTKSSPSTSACAWLVVLILVNPLVAYAQTFSGSVVVRGYTAPDTQQYAVPVKFTVVVDGARWSIQSEYKNYDEYFTGDGKHIYSHKKFSSESLRETLGDQASGAIPNAEVVSVAFPFIAEPVTRLLWFAYCSADVLSDDIQIPSLWNSDFRDPAAYSVHIRDVHHFEGTSQRIESCRFVLSESTLNSAAKVDYVHVFLKNSDVQSLRKFVAKQFDDRLIAEYKAKFPAEREGIIGPAEFQLDVFAPRGNGESFVMQAYRGVVTNIAAARTIEVPPRLAIPTQVHDYRFMAKSNYVEDVSYVSTNGQWLDVDDPRLQELFQRQNANYKLASEIRERRLRFSHYGGLALAALLVLAPIVLWKYGIIRKGADMKT